MARQCASKSYQKPSVVKGHHVIWTPEVGEELPVNCEYSNEHAVAVLKDGEIVGHLPRTISRVSWFFLRRGSFHGLKLSCNSVRFSFCSHCKCHVGIVPRPRRLLETLLLFRIQWGLHQAFVRDQRLIEEIRYISKPCIHILLKLCMWPLVVSSWITRLDGAFDLPLKATQTIVIYLYTRSICSVSACVRW